jgi:DNA-binding LacI/PurR family transcriptional regulator
MLHGVSVAAERHRLSMNFRYVSDADDLKDRILSGKIDGVLLHGALPKLSQIEEIRRLPTVWLMGNRNRSEWGDQVMPNHYECGCLAAKHLLRRGHRRLAYLNLDRGHWGMHLYGHAFTTTAEQAGAQAVVLERERELAGGYWHEYSTASVDAMVQQFLALPDRPTGIYVAEDMQVAVLQPALQRAGIEIGPNATEIVSTNNEQPYLQGLSPKPTEIDIRPESVGHRGVEQLLWRIANPTVPEQITTMIEPVLIDLAKPASL